MTLTADDAHDHGGDAERIAMQLGIPIGDLIDLSASLNPFAPPLDALVQRHVAAVGRYPDPSMARAAVAAAFDVAAEEVLLTNGGAEAIALACRYLDGIGVRPRLRDHDFALYRRHLRSVSQHGPLVASNPASPAGTLAADPTGPGVAMWDEAFWPLATGTWTSGAHRHGGTVVVGSFTKVFACPGLRLGYVLAEPDVIRTLACDQPRWAVSTLALDMLPELLATADLPAWRTRIAEQRTTLMQQLTQHGFQCEPGVNWVLAGKPGWSGAALRERMLGTGVLVRDCASFGRPDRVRIALPRAEHTDALHRALAAVD